MPTLVESSLFRPARLIRKKMHRKPPIGKLPYAHPVGVTCQRYLTSVGDLELLANTLRSTDIPLLKYHYLSDGVINIFSQPFKMIGLVKEYDGDVPAIVSAVNTYDIKTLMYNVEGLSAQDTQTRLETTYAAFRALSDVPFVFAPIWFNFITYYDDYIPYCDGFYLQLQNQPIADWTTLAASAISNTRALKPNAKMYFQVSCLGETYTYDQIVTAIRDMESLDFDGLFLWFAVLANWNLCYAVLSDLT